MFHVSEFDNWYLIKYNNPLQHEQKEFELVIQNSNLNSTALDVGANSGVWTYKLSQHFQHVISFEPVRQSYESLVKNCTRENTNLHQLALGNIQKPILMYVVKGNTGASFVVRDDKKITGRVPRSFEGQTFQKVNQSTLDHEIADEKIGFLKIDVEGYELEVLEGAKHVLIKNKPLVLIEINVVSNPESFNRQYLGYNNNKKLLRDNIFLFLKNLGYNSHTNIKNNYIFSTLPIKT